MSATHECVSHHMQSPWGRQLCTTKYQAHVPHSAFVYLSDLQLATQATRFSFALSRPAHHHLRLYMPRYFSVKYCVNVETLSGSPVTASMSSSPLLNTDPFSWMFLFSQS